MYGTYVCDRSCVCVNRLCVVVGFVCVYVRSYVYVCVLERERDCINVRQECVRA